ncbi:Flagellar hook protein FlgE [Planctomycetes bacterium Pan216]|uniref:Flagellar hook protein FlgE n=1 Tax=Kolteria novifilia TaxID=2527975 RepID=A0A518B6H8_9BACT|nr:Flagellar hook protein FlgE [Planctomycetes bacterium Pan216]
MGIGPALSTAISGLSVNESAIDVIGNNLANTTTTAYKRFRVQFVNNFLSTSNFGSSPVNGLGSNPTQFGQGARLGGVNVDTQPGAPTQTGLPSDLYIQGIGYFVVSGNDQEQLFTRDGGFAVNANSELVTSEGLKVQGFGIDEEFEIQQTVLTDIEIPLGSLQVAEATTEAFMDGTLNPDGDLSTNGTRLQSVALSAATAATQLDSITLAGGGPSLIDDGLGGGNFSGPVELTYTPRRGASFLEPATITLNPTDSLSTLTDFLADSLGIDTSLDSTALYDSTTTVSAGGPVPDDFRDPGVYFEGDTIPPSGDVVPAGTIQVIGNLGTVNDFTISATDFEVRPVSDPTVTGRLDLSFPTTVAQATGESSQTTFAVFDSLGNPVEVTAAVYLQSLGTEFSEFRIVFSSPDQSLDPNNLPAGVASPFDRGLGSAVLRFDSRGQLDSVTGTDLTVYRQLTGAANPLQFNVNVDQIAALAVDQSRLAVVSQDGSPTGVLIDFGIQADGTIVGAFDNGVSRPLGQVALARFANPAGLVQIEGNLLRSGPNSGLPFITTPGESVGSILSGFLELSNVEISESFVDLITASTGFAANGRVIATSQDLIDTLLQLPR